MSHIITLSGDYGRTQYRVSSLDAGTYINADGATWIVDNSTSDGTPAQNYPFYVSASATVTLDGGRIWGTVNQDRDWAEVYHDPIDGYNGNSAAILVKTSPGVIIKDWRIDRPWDGIRPESGSNNFLIEDVWISNGRDDAIENDDMHGGTIRDVLFDGN